jgi:hypothetical protein
MKKIIIFSLSILLFSSYAWTQNILERKVASLKGSKQSMLLQNQEADREGLVRIKNTIQLERFIKDSLLVSIQKIENVTLDYRMSDSFSYVKPVTALFIKNSSAYYFKNFGLYWQVNSAVRPTENQKYLRNSNSNAAPTSGPLASTHSTGATIDISYLGMSDKQMKWMRNYLLYCEAKCWIEATEEHSQTVFHIMVFQSYCKIKLK